MIRRGGPGWILWPVVVGVRSVVLFRDNLTDHDVIGASVYALFALVGLGFLIHRFWAWWRAKGSEVGSQPGGQVAAHG